MTNEHRKPDVELAQEILLDAPAFLREIVERVMQELLETEMTEHIGAAPYERTENRNGHRNGYKPRTLRTRVGTLNLLVPAGPGWHLLHPAVCALPAQREGAGFGADGDVHRRRLHQEGHRDHGGAVRHLLLQEPRLAAGRHAWTPSSKRGGAARWRPNLPLRLRRRPLREGEDGRTGREPGRPGRLGGAGTTGCGRSSAVEVADTESEATYQELFRSLKARGLKGVELVICDDHEGLKAAIARHFQGASQQRCQVHYSRNLLGMVGPQSARS